MNSKKSMVTCIFSKLRQAASSIVIDDRRIVLWFLSFNNSWSLVCAQKICFTEQEKHSNQSSIITKARYVFPKMHVDSIRYKSWMLKAGSDPPGFRHTLKLINYARDLSIQKLRHLVTRKQLETEMHMETTRCSFGGTYCLYTVILISSVQSNPQFDPKSRETV